MQCGARAIHQGHRQGQSREGLSTIARRCTGVEGRNVRRAQADDGQLALGGRAVLPAHRQGARHAAERDRDTFQAGTPGIVSRYADRATYAE